MSLEDQQKRYITLDGNPVHKGWLRSMFSSAECKAGLLCTAFNMLASSSDTNSLITNTIVSTAALVGTLSVLRGMDRFIAAAPATFGGTWKTLAVDTSPDRRIPVNNSRYEEPVSEALSLGLALALLPVAQEASFTLRGFGSTIMPIANGVFSNIPPDGWTCATTMTMAMVATTGVKIAHRYLMIDKNKWAIVDMPKKEKQKEKTSVFNPLPQPTQG